MASEAASLPPVTARKRLPTWAIVVGIVMMLGFIGYVYNQDWQQRPIPKMTAEERKNRDYIQGIVQRSGGDYNRMNAKDRAWLLKLAGRDEFARYAYDDVKANPRPLWY